MASVLIRLVRSGGGATRRVGVFSLNESPGNYLINQMDVWAYCSLSPNEFSKGLGAYGRRFVLKIVYISTSYILTMIVILYISL
jgi:hypothetical protein